MFRRLLTVTLGACACVVLAVSANASIFITSNGDVNLTSSQGGSPPTTGIRYLSGSGEVFTNQTNGLAFAVGSEVRTIAVQEVTGAQDGTLYPVSLKDGNNLLVVTAILGTITANDGFGHVTATFTQGRSFLTEGLSTYNKYNPSTWDFSARFAEYGLVVPPEAVVSGAPTGYALNLAPGQVNQSTVNSQSVQEQFGNLLFREDSTAAENQGSTPGMGPNTGGDNFLSNVALVPSVSPLPKMDEGFLAGVGQTLQTTDLNNGGFTFTSSDLNALNAIAAAASFSDLGTNQQFATGTSTSSGAASKDWAPFAGGPTGDFYANLDADNYVGYEPMPEPTSVIVWGGLLIGGLCVRRRRRKK